jgi:diketogulonate reductase-like aldo/keto reductase
LPPSPSAYIESVAKEIIKTAFEAGINMFDTAESYADGKSELEMYVLSIVQMTGKAADVMTQGTRD